MRSHWMPPSLSNTPLTSFYRHPATWALTTRSNTLLARDSTLDMLCYFFKPVAHFVRFPKFAEHLDQVKSWIFTAFCYLKFSLAAIESLKILISTLKIKWWLFFIWSYQFAYIKHNQTWEKMDPKKAINLFVKSFYVH